MSVVLLVLALNEIDGRKKIMPKVKTEAVDRVIIVDGGSTDGTIEKAKELGFDVIHQKNRGEGNACRVGTDATESDFVMLLSFIMNDNESIDLADINFDLAVDIFDLLLLSEFLQDM